MPLNRTEVRLFYLRLSLRADDPASLPASTGDWDGQRQQEKSATGRELAPSWAGQ